MTRYQRAKQILDSMRPEDRRICEAKGPCACRGCASIYKITKSMLELYNKGELK